jgi:hypothetical protein
MPLGLFGLMRRSVPTHGNILINYARFCAQALDSATLSEPDLSPTCEK